MIHKEVFRKILTLIICSLFLACNDPSYFPKKKPTVAPLTFTPFYHQLLNGSTSSFNHQDSTALGIYMMDILRVGRPEDSTAQVYFQSFLENKDMKELGRHIDSTFNDLSEVEYEISQAWAYFQHYFKITDTPKIYYINSGFNSGAYVDGKEILIGLDMYLGKDNELLKRLPPDRFAQYIKDKMDIAHLPADIIIQAIAEKAYQEPKKANMLEYMVAYGKIQYLLDLCMPYTPDHLKMRYSAEEVDYLQKSEAEIWRYIVREKYLYSNEYDKYSPWFSVGPFTSTLAQESPDRVGIYMGWMMLRSYMAKHRDLTIDQIIQLNSEEILKEYKP